MMMMTMLKKEVMRRKKVSSQVTKIVTKTIDFFCYNSLTLQVWDVCFNGINHSLAGLFLKVCEVF